MSEHTTELSPPRAWIVPMQPRSPTEVHRAATTLELFFDLVFVVAVAQAAAALHHSLAEGHFGSAALSYIMVFFAIWWAWMNFTWFASAYDCDDVPYRLAVFVILTGALILAAGVPQAFEGDFAIVTGGYVVMRLALVTQWLRAARSDPPRRVCAHRYAIGISACQIGWVILLFVPGQWSLMGFALLVAAELLVPIWAERAGATTWHPHHIMERYGLFTIIVLGESILSTSLGIQSAIETGNFSSDLIGIIVGGLLIIFSMWWLYFDWPMDVLLTSLRRGFIWGYSHLFVFASAAAVGAGLAVEIDQALHHAEIGAVAAGATVAIPVAIFVATLWLLHIVFRIGYRLQMILIPVVLILVLLTPLSGSRTALLTGILLVALLVIKLVHRHRESA
ncbi:MAG TPA: low temperature requirement protein A [Anaerolineae bacterium]|nr:low temperature requirement protein A [Anaerolineae bacterium]